MPGLELTPHSGTGGSSKDLPTDSPKDRWAHLWPRIFLLETLHWAGPSVWLARPSTAQPVCPSALTSSLHPGYFSVTLGSSQCPDIL